MRLCVKVVEQLGTVLWVVRVATQALVEDGASRVCEGVVLADREAAGEKSIRLQRLIELELGVGNDVAGTSLLIFEDTTLESDDRC